MVSYTNGVVKACGAEAMQDFEEDKQNVAYWFKVTECSALSNASFFWSRTDLWLKLHLHPPSKSQSNTSKLEIPPLPADVTIERVYADMMGYLMKHTQRFFEATTPNGAEIWTRVRDTITIVLATPNAWDIRQQATLRNAAIMASLVTQEKAGQLLQFVTEAEASVHYVLSHRPGAWLKERTLFAVVDCGGSTVDTTVYRCIATSPLSLKEACPSESVQVLQLSFMTPSRLRIKLCWHFHETGGVFVERELTKILKRKLNGTSFSNPKIIRRMVDSFERDVSSQSPIIVCRTPLWLNIVG
jgi:hypothetical protein